MNGPWGLFGLALSAALVICTPFVWRARGAVFGLRWFGAAILPAGLALTGLFTLFARVGTAVTNFFADNLSPLAWVGYAMLGFAVLTWVVAGAVSSRRAARSPGGVKRAAPKPAAVGAPRKSIGGSSSPVSAGDDEFADIEAILRRRGI